MTARELAGDGRETAPFRAGPGPERDVRRQRLADDGREALAFLARELSRTLEREAVEKDCSTFHGIYITCVAAGEQEGTEVASGAGVAHSVYVRVLWLLRYQMTAARSVAMPKTDSSFNPDEYALVADRIALFYEHYPNGRIIPRLHSVTREAVVFEARVYRNDSDTQPAAVGWAREFEGDGAVNAVACLENTETSAIGRALANLGFAASKKRPSYEEMMKADRARRRLQAANPSTPTVIRNQSTAGAALQAKANIAMDLVRRVRIAQRLGLDSRRADSLVARVSAPGVTDRDLARLEGALQRWLARRNETRFMPR